MQEKWKTIVLRHRRENLRKCSLQPLVGHPDLTFISYPFAATLPAFRKHTLILSFDGPLLSEKDSQSDLVLIDATWQLAAKMEKGLAPSINQFEKRSLPDTIRTAYPRKQTGCIDPLRGLASVEALFVAFKLMGRETTALLDHYYWKEEFLALNQFLR
jgi:pre-rRNA-processing protein TSR3